VFLQLAAILIDARLGGEFATRLGAPSVIGELAVAIVPETGYLPTGALSLYQHSVSTWKEFS
jgi:Kef-type K+ transport system membrane component KefB